MQIRTLNPYNNGSSYKRVAHPPERINLAFEGNKDNRTTSAKTKKIAVPLLTLITALGPIPGCDRSDKPESISVQNVEMAEKEIRDKKAQISLEVHSGWSEDKITGTYGTNDLKKADFEAKFTTKFLGDIDIKGSCQGKVIDLLVEKRVFENWKIKGTFMDKSVDIEFSEGVINNFVKGQFNGKPVDIKIRGNWNDGNLKGVFEGQTVDLTRTSNLTCPDELSGTFNGESVKLDYNDNKISGKNDLQDRSQFLPILMKALDILQDKEDD